MTSVYLIPLVNIQDRARRQEILLGFEVKQRT